MSINSSAIIPRKKRPISVDMYHQMIDAGILTELDKVELILGEIIDMSPVGSKHATTVKVLNHLLQSIYAESAVIGVQDPVELPNNSMPEPDISILKPPFDHYFIAHPSPAEIWALIEVSDETYKFDKGTKLRMYASANIALYMIVNIQGGCIEVHTQPKNDTYTRQEILFPGDRLTLPLTDKTLAISDIIRSA
ncbi:MAG: Uma2 family endonuclease [Bacteroidia bacterium]